MRLGLFGGSFNPVHIGHIAAANAAIETLKLDRLLFIPSGHPPLKGNSGLAAGYHRLEMLKIATGGDPRFGLCDYEILRDGPSYSVDTIEHIAAMAGPDTQLYFLLGSDCADRLSQWKGIDRIKRLIRFAIISRNGENISKLPPELLSISMPPIAASSTAVRAAQRDEQTLSKLLDDGVLAYMRRHRLYYDDRLCEAANG